MKLRPSLKNRRKNLIRTHEDSEMLVKRQTKKYGSLAGSYGVKKKPTFSSIDGGEMIEFSTAEYISRY